MDKYKCKACVKTFKSYEAQNVHYQTYHATLKTRFGCVIDGCTANYTQLKSLKEHHGKSHGNIEMTHFYRTLVKYYNEGK